MKAMTVVAVAALAAGIYHYRRYRGPKRAPSPRVADDLLAERVRAGIAGAASAPIDVRVAKGIVTLRGTVKRAERDLALAAALGVPGVSRVTSQLEVEGPGAEPAGAEHGPMKSGFSGGR